ncbi:MAG: hypothetical protein OEO19_12775 [Gammaproteobacteria bacterium]|nr:hypothetical protein [Gammaproteobacteria bacterium]MDH3450633.1 hypothetical protein [Gammaproteobacteria bacterium]
MNGIEKLLSDGDLRTTGKSAEVVNQVKSNPELFGEVVGAILVGNPGVRMRASDALEKITREFPEWLGPYKNRIIDEIANIDQKEVRWHAAQVMPRLPLTKKDRKKVYEILQSYLKDESSIVKTFAMQALTDIAMQDRYYLTRVRRQINDLSKSGSPAMKSRGRKLLDVLYEG